jgi:hypothetical protein
MAPEIERRGVRAGSMKTESPLPKVWKGFDEGLALLTVEGALPG